MRKSDRPKGGSTMKKNINIENLPMVHVMNHQAPVSPADQGKEIGWKAAAAGAVAIATVLGTWAAKKATRQNTKGN